MDTIGSREFWVPGWRQAGLFLLLVVLAHPLASILLAAYRQAEGADIVRGGAQGWVGFAFVLVLMSLLSAVLATALAATGAGVRLLLDHARRRRSGTPQDARTR